MVHQTPTLHRPLSNSTLTSRIPKHLTYHFSNPASRGSSTAFNLFADQYLDLGTTQSPCNYRGTHHRPSACAFPMRPNKVVPSMKRGISGSGSPVHVTDTILSFEHAIFRDGKSYCAVPRSQASLQPVSGHAQIPEGWGQLRCGDEMTQATSTLRVKS